MEALPVIPFCGLLFLGERLNDEHLGHGRRVVARDAPRGRTGCGPRSSGIRSRHGCGYGWQHLRLRGRKCPVQRNRVFGPKLQRILLTIQGEGPIVHILQLASPTPAMPPRAASCMPDDIPPPLPPLVGDPARQADDLNRGITYQVWRSVEAWVGLGDRETLYLEGLEDFDVVGKGAAVAVQVKATAAAVTLRSDSVIELLLNFWRARADNLGREVHYRLVTTSAVGMEKDSPLGSKGLELWAECAARGDLEKVARLQQFLATDESVAGKLVAGQGGPSPSLAEFLKTATAPEVLDKLIRRITFLPGSEDAEAVSESVTMTLRAYGEKHGVRPSECGPALDRLFRVAAEVAGRKGERYLTRDRFRREFEEATTQRLTAGEIDAIRSAAAIPMVPGGLPGVGASFGIAVGAELVVQRGVPELPKSTLDRVDLVKDVVAHLRKVGLVVIRGSSGMGKSTIAQLVAKEIGEDWLWVDFQGLPPAAIPHVARSVSLAFVQAGSPKNLALDNLNFEPADLVGLENALAATSRTARTRGGMVLLTTQRELPVRVQSKLGAQPADLIDIPRLTDDEIEKFCLLLGCPAQIAAAWAKILAIQTYGHPRLVHARLVALEAAKWPAVRASDLLATTPEVHEELDLAAQLLDRAPAGDKELIYRLSVATGPFRKDHAVALGNTLPAIPFAADSFARLVGPWIDRLRSGYFRLSPLLLGAAQRNWSDEQVRQARSGLARAMLKCGEKSVIEANETLFQALLAKDEEAVTAVAVSLVTTGAEQIERFAERMDWLTLMGRKGGQPLFEGNPSVNIILRLLQFRIMTATSPEHANELCEIVDQEFAVLDSKSAKESRAMWLSTVLIYFQGMVHPHNLLRYWAELRTITESSPVLKRVTRALGRSPDRLPDLPDTDAAGQLLLMVFARKCDDAMLVAFADAVNALPAADRDAFLSYLPSLEFPFRLLVDRAWFQESDKASPNWQRVLDNLAAFETRTATWNAPFLSGFVARAVAMIEDEYRNAPDAALAVLDRALGAGVGAARLVEDQKALVLYRLKRHRDALDIWKRILQDWPLAAKTLDRSFFLASQRAGHCAGVLGDLPTAIEIFQCASAKAKVVGSRLVEATFQADHALAEWKSGAKSNALALFAHALSKLEGLKPGDETNFEIHRARKTVEHTARWFQFDAGVRDEDIPWEPPLGTCSRIEADEKIMEVPAAPFDFVWFFLADAEQSLGLGTTIFDQAWKRRRKSNYAAFRGFMSGLRLQRAFSTLEFSSLIQDVDDLVQTTAQVKSMHKAGMPPWAADMAIKLPREDATLPIEDAITAAFIALQLGEADPQKFFPAWEASGRHLPDGPAVAKLIQAAKRAWTADETALPAMYRDDPEKLARSLTALRMSKAANLPIEALVAGHASLTGFVFGTQFKRYIEGPWAELVRSEWLRVISQPALLPTPQLTVPPIRRACHDVAVGLKLAAKILLEARHVATFSIPADVVDRWRKAAE